MTETVNHPVYYGGDTTYEAIKVINAWGLNFELGSALKYICRAEHKGSQLEDLRKAAWYVQHEIERVGGVLPACTHAWEELNPGNWLYKECGADVDLTRSPDWTPPVEMSPGAFMEVGPVETIAELPHTTLAGLLAYLTQAVEYNADVAARGPLDARAGADRARWAYDDAKVKLERLMAAVSALDPADIICGAIGRHGKCVFAKSHQSICRNSNGLGIS